MIRIRNVYKSFSPTLHPLQGIDLDINDGETIVLLGRSGAGKSVLLKTIIRLIEPDGGSILVDDVEVVDADMQTLLQVRRKVGYVFQSGALFDSFTVGQNLAFPLEKGTTLSKKEREEKVMYYLEQVGLPDKINRMPSELSGGQRKRIGVARTIIAEPDYLLYDEPTTGLDPETTREISQLINKLKQDIGVTGVVVTHDPYCLQLVADRVASIQDGRIAFIGTQEEAKNADDPFLDVYFSIEHVTNPS